MRKLSLAFAAVLAAVGLVAGEVTARAEVITLYVSATLTASSGGATCLMTCTLGGSFMIDNTTGTVLTGPGDMNITASGFSPTVGPFTSPVAPGEAGNFTELALINSNADEVFLYFLTPTLGSFVGYTGGPLISPTASTIGTFLEGAPSGLTVPRWNLVSGSLTTPLPATLPLFATGLGALGLLGWRRKRKARVSLLGTT